MAKLTINQSKIKQSLNKAFTGFVDKVVDAATDQIEAVKWDWDRVTVRSTGEIVYTPRNIVDTGYLRDSVLIDRTGQTSATITWEADYAAQVHLERPWVYATMVETDFVQLFKDSI